MLNFTLFYDCSLKKNFLTVVLIVFGVVGPAEAGAESKVGELDVPVGVDQDVVGLDVPMDEAHLVHAVHRAHQLGDVKSKQK